VGAKPYGFTGKEEDVEVGLVYFGKRFYAPGLQRWVSADPLEVHRAASGEPNLYSYVRGAPLALTDLVGLEDDGKDWSLFEAVKANVVGLLDVAGVPSTVYEAGGAAVEGNYSEAASKVGEAMVRGSYAPIVITAEAVEGVYEVGAAGVRLATDSEQPGDRQTLANGAVGAVAGVLLAKFGRAPKGGSEPVRPARPGAPVEEAPKPTPSTPDETVEWLGGQAVHPDDVAVKSGDSNVQYTTPRHRRRPSRTVCGKARR
jgi:RHS repeat-associated protein